MDYYLERDPRIEVWHGDSLELMKNIPDNSIDAVVTDPPYGLKFMGKKWDYDVPSVELWKEVFRVMKPGGHLLSFFGTRTYHRGVTNIEDAGFEIRDMIQWLYGSGFPKSMDISKAIDKEFGKLDEREVIGHKIDISSGKAMSIKQAKAGAEKNSHEGWDRPWKHNDEHAGRMTYITAPATPEAKEWDGWGTALKPSCEPIVLARKPISEKNIAQNVLKWGTGGLNIDDCRITLNGEKIITHHKEGEKIDTYDMGWGFKKINRNPDLGRFPANVILDEEASKMLDKQSGELKSGLLTPNHKKGDESGYLHNYGIYGKYSSEKKDLTYGDKGGASRFFYVAKASKNERWGYCHFCDKPIKATDADKHIHDAIEKYGKTDKYRYLEFHPTVKPLKLMNYLIKLVTPKNATLLDPFMGTGTTLVECKKLGINAIGIDLLEINCEIAKARIADIPRRLDGWIE